MGYLVHGLDKDVVSFVVGDFDRGQHRQVEGVPLVCKHF